MSYAFTDAFCTWKKSQNIIITLCDFEEASYISIGFGIGHAVFHIAMFRDYVPIIIDIGWVT